MKSIKDDGYSKKELKRIGELADQLGKVVDGESTEISLQALAFVTSQVLSYANEDMSVFGTNAAVFLNQMVEFACVAHAHNINFDETLH